MTARELGRLGESSRRVARSALRTIERDMEEATWRMRALLLRTWLGTFGGSSATMHWRWTRIQVRIETAAELDFDSEEARRTLAQLEVETWGVTLREIEGERCVVLPAGSPAYPRWTWRHRPAVKLSRE